MAGDRITDIVNTFQSFIHTTARGFAAEDGGSYDKDLADDLISEGNCALVEAAGKIIESGLTYTTKLESAIINRMKKYVKQESQLKEMQHYSTLPIAECKYNPSKQHIDRGLHCDPLMMLMADEDSMDVPSHSNTRL